jgi:threonine/homoserine/homoserine lactone efflux protein
MKLSAPKQITFWIAVALEVIGILDKLVSLPLITSFATAIMIIGFVVLAAGNVIDGL